MFSCFVLIGAMLLFFSLSHRAPVLKGYWDCWAPSTHHNRDAAAPRLHREPLEHLHLHLHLLSSWNVAQAEEAAVPNQPFSPAPSLLLRTAWHRLAALFRRTHTTASVHICTWKHTRTVHHRDVLTGSDEQMWKLSAAPPPKRHFFFLLVKKKIGAGVVGIGGKSSRVLLFSKNLDICVQGEGFGPEALMVSIFHVSSADRRATREQSITFLF